MKCPQLNCNNYMRKVTHEPMLLHMAHGTKINGDELYICFRHGYMCKCHIMRTLKWNKRYRKVRGEKMPQLNKDEHALANFWTPSEVDGNEGHFTTAPITDTKGEGDDTFQILEGEFQIGENTKTLRVTNTSANKIAGVYGWNSDEWVGKEMLLSSRKVNIGSGFTIDITPRKPMEASASAGFQKTLKGNDL